MYCTKCGTGVAEGAVFCSVCGQPTSGRVAASPAPIVAGVPVTYPNPPAAGWVPPPQMPYAGFWLRFVAYFIDSFLVGTVFLLVFVILAMVLGIGSGLGNMRSGEDLGAVFAVLGFTVIFFGIVIGIVGVWLYFAMMESSTRQATFGKQAMGIKVTDMAGQRISFGRASGRHFSKFITGLIPLAIGYIMAGFTEKKQAIHDMIASCLVVRKA